MTDERDRGGGTAAGGEVWVLPGPVGDERWRREGGRFVAAQIGDRRVVPGERRFDLDRFGLRSASCAHPGPWPNAFRFCPECGAALAPPVEARGGAAGGPEESADGWPVRRGVGDPLPDTRRDEPMPPAGSFVFACGTPEHLFAQDWRGGWLRARREADGSWEELGRIAPVGLPPDGWSVALLEPGMAGAAWFVLPTEHGPVAVGENGAIGPASGFGACVGGAIRLRGRAVVPVRTSDGIALAVASGPGGPWSLARLPDGTAWPDAGGWFAAPVGLNGDAFWCGGAGVLVASGGTDGITVGFRAWEPGFAPVPGTRPVLTPDGRAFRLGRIEDERLAFAELVLPGAAGAERRAVNSLWLSAGIAAFVDARRRRLPWDDTRGRGDYAPGEGRFLLPLLALDENRFVLAGVPERETLGRFLAGNGELRRCDLWFSPGTRRLEPLLRGLEVRHPADLSAFVFRNRLFVVEATNNRGWSWALSGAAAA